VALVCEWAEISTESLDRPEQESTQSELESKQQQQQQQRVGLEQWVDSSGHGVSEVYVGKGGLLVHQKQSCCCCCSCHSRFQ
jgi:hypothetical protein